MIRINWRSGLCIVESNTDFGEDAGGNLNERCGLLVGIGRKYRLPWLYARKLQPERAKQISSSHPRGCRNDSTRMHFAPMADRSNGCVRKLVGRIHLCFAEAGQDSLLILMVCGAALANAPSFLDYFDGFMYAVTPMHLP